jgi:hypothetical protein
MHKKTEHIGNSNLSGRAVNIRMLVLVLVFAVSVLTFFLISYFKSRPDVEKSPYEIQHVYNKSLFMPGVETGVLNKERITEASGIVASRKNPGVFWVHNDSGNSATIYAIKADGEFISAYRVKQAKSRDWEDIAIGPGPEKGVDYIYIGNIGDNNMEYASVAVYRVEEPKVEINQAAGSADKSEDIRIGPATEIELLYPDGPKDAETLLVDPLNGDIYIITKSKSSGLVYMASYPQTVGRKTTLEFVAEIPMAKATGGDVSPDGTNVIVRASKSAGLWKRPAGQKLWMAFIDQPVWIDLADETQGEAICFDTQGSGFYTLSEMKHPSIYYFARMPSE